MTPLVGSKPWFGPRGLGWGWEPISWEGWISSLCVLAGAFWPGRGGDVAMKAAKPVAVCALLLVLCLLKGTSPGGPKTKAEYDRRRRFPGGAAEQRMLRQTAPDEADLYEALRGLRATGQPPSSSDAPPEERRSVRHEGV